MSDKMKMQAEPMDKILEKVMAICPNAVQNGKVNFERLREELADVVDDNIKESYDFTWVGKRKAIIEANTSIRKTLRPAKEESKNWDTTENLYIEGDNLDVLKLLQESYLGKVKMIYIDPPYNTGKDFIYEDNFSKSKAENDEEIGVCDDEGNKLFKNTESNGRFHSDWCSMIYPRLKLARDFLSDDGVIFISIDDNEQANLKKICDEIFGEDNFLATLKLEISLTQGMKVGAAQKGKIVKNGEYILCYTKSELNFKGVNILYDGINGYDTHFSIYLNDKLEMLSMGAFIENEKSLHHYYEEYKLEKNFKSFCSLIEVSNKFKSEIYEKYSNCLFQSMMATIKVPASILKELEKGLVVKYEKYILHQVESGKIRQLLPLSSTLGNTDDYIVTYSRRRIRGDFWKGFYSDMMNVAKEGGLEFKNGKKPVRLVKQLIKWANLKSSDIVLDFFSGSATTAHAVMQLNAEDGGKRKFIMVQLPEVTDEKSEAYKGGYKTICDIGKERIRRAGEKIKAEYPDAKDLDIGFRVLKVDDSNMKDVYYSPAELNIEKLLGSVNNIKEDRTPLDLLFGILVDWGLPLSLSITEKKIKDNTIYIVGKNDLIFCFDSNISDKTINEIANLHPTRAVFRDNCFAKNDAKKINTFELFKSISPNTNIKVL